MMIKRTKVWAVIGLMLTSVLSFGQSIDQVIKDLDAERYTAAIDGANKLTVSSPSVDTYFLKGYTVLSSPDYAKPENLKLAQTAFEAGNALEKKGSPLNQVGLGMVKLASKDLAGAKAIFDEVKKSTKSKDANILYRIAEAYTMFPEANDPAEAILTVDLAIEKSKVVDNPEFYFVKSDAYMLKNDGGNAMNALNNAERLGKKQGKTYEKMAKIWLHSRNYKDANDVILKGIAADPTHAPIYKYQSSYQQTFGDFAKSAEAATNYLKNSDGDVNAKLRASKLYFIAEDYASLKRILSEIKGSTNDPYIYRMEGIVNFKEGKYNESIKDFEKFIKANPKDENFSLDYGYMGRSYLKMQGADEAAQNSNDNLGVSFIEKAVALKDSTADTDYYAEAIAILKERKSYEKASQLSEKSLLLKKEPNSSEFATTAMDFYYAQNWGKASQYLEKALAGYEGRWPVGYALNGIAIINRDRNDTTKNALYLDVPEFEKYLTAIGEEGKANPNNATYVVLGLKRLAGKDMLNKDYVAGKAKIEEILKYAPDDQDAVTMLHGFNKMIDPKYVVPTSPTDSTGKGNGSGK